MAPRPQTELLDDRGINVPRREADIASNLSGHTSSDTVRLLRAVVTWLPLILPIVVGACLYPVLRAKGDAAAAMILTGCFMVFPCFFPVSWGFRRAILDKMRSPSPRQITAATLLASGRCAACGYRLAANTPATDGEKLVTCPECGAAWNRDRLPEA